MHQIKEKREQLPKDNKNKKIKEERKMKKIIYVTMMMLMMTITASAKKNRVVYVDNRPRVIVVNVADRHHRHRALRPAPRPHRPATVVVYNSRGSWRHTF